MILSVTVASLAISLVIAILSADPFITVSCAENRYSFEFRQKLIRASPRWSEDERNPPISVRDAMEIADEIGDNLDSVSKSYGIGKWTFDSLSLTHLNIGYRDMRTKNSSTNWCYLVHFRPYRSADHELATFMILMDGTVIVAEHAWLNDGLEMEIRELYETDDNAANQN